MASHIREDSNVNLSFFWKGSDKLKGWLNGWEVALLEVKMTNMEQEVSLNLPRSTSEEYKQLKVAVKQGLSSSNCDTLLVPIELVKTMKISARILKDYVTPYGEHRVRGDWLNVDLAREVAYEPGKEYQIKLHVNEEGRGRSVTAEIVRVEARAEAEEEKAPHVDHEEERMRAQRELGERMIAQGMQTLQQQLGIPPQMLMGLQAMIDATVQTAQDNTDLAGYSIEELETRLAVANVDLNRARANFNAALASGNPVRIQRALAEKQSISAKVIQLSGAVERRGAEVAERAAAPVPAPVAQEEGDGLPLFSSDEDSSDVEEAPPAAPVPAPADEIEDSTDADIYEIYEEPPAAPVAQEEAPAPVADEVPADKDKDCVIL